MSYILDALRKSDQQRRRGGVPTLPAAPATAAPAERPAFLLYGLLGLILIAVGMAIGWLRPWRQEPPPVAPLAAKPLEALPRPPEAAPPAKAGAKMEQEPARQEPPPAASSTPASRREAPATAETHDKPPMAVVAKPSEAGTATSEEHAGKGPSDGAPEQKFMARSDLPLAIQQELPPMSVAMHAYSSQARGRLVSIDGRVLREGDSLTPELRLEQITPDGMIFTYRGYRFRHGVH